MKSLHFKKADMSPLPIVCKKGTGLWDGMNISH